MIKQTKLSMGMPITVAIVDPGATRAALKEVFDYFRHVDETFSTYKPTSEITRINNGLSEAAWSDEMKTVLQLCEQTKQATRGYFDIRHNGTLDPSGLVKGWAIHNAAQLLAGRGFRDFFVEAGGDIQVGGHNADGQPWRVGIRNPFDRHQNIKALAVTTEGVATSGTYIRGQHIYDPHDHNDMTDLASFTVVGPNIYEADRFATAAFAMGAAGIEFIESMAGLEGYTVESNGVATLTSGFDRYVVA